MAISFVSNYELWSFDTKTSTATIPSEAEAGDFALLYVSTQGLETAPTVAGWSLVGSNVQTDSMASSVYQRRLVSGDANSTVSVTGTLAVPRILSIVCYRGVDPTTPIEGQAFASTLAASATSSVVTPSAGVTTSLALSVEFVVSSGGTGCPFFGSISELTARSVACVQALSPPASPQMAATVENSTATYASGATAGGHTLPYQSGATPGQSIRRTFVLRPDAGFTPPPDADPDGPGMMQFEGGTDGGAATAATTGATAVVGTGLVHRTSSAVHGSLGLTSTNGASYLSLDKPTGWFDPNGSHVGSIYVRPRSMTDGASRIITLSTASLQTVAAIRFHADKRITISDSSGLALAESTVKWISGTVYRIDWQYASGAQQLTLRVYAGARSEWPDKPDHEFSAQVNSGGFGPFTKFLISPNLASGSGANQIDIDTFRVFDFGTWPTGFAPVAGAGTVLHSWLGAPTSSGFRVKAHFSGAQSIRLAVSTAASMTSPVYSAVMTPDNLQYVDVTFIGLTANTQYYYQWEDTPSSGSPSLIGTVGKAHTLPAPGQQSFTFTLSANLATGATDAAALTSASAWNPLFNVFAGNLHYSGSTATTSAAHMGDYQAQIASIPALAAFLRDTPQTYIPGAGEVGGRGSDTNTDYGSAHLEAYQRVVPTYALTPDSDGITRSRHQSWTVGRIRFILLDTRNLDRSSGANPDVPGKTMLGADQLSWLKNELIRSEPVKVIITDSAWMGPADLSNGNDRWWAYSTERDEIVNYISANSVNAVLLHGDTNVLGVATPAKNAYGEFPVYVGAPLNGTGGGLNQSEFSAVYNYANGAARGYGRVTVTDSGTITFLFSGWDATAGVQRITQTDVFTLASSVTVTGAGAGSAQSSANGVGDVVAPPLGDIPVTTVSGSFVDDSGIPLTGKIIFTPSVDQVISAATGVIVRVGREEVNLVDGAFSINLLATEVGWPWTYQLVDQDGLSASPVKFWVPVSQSGIQLNDYLLDE